MKNWLMLGLVAVALAGCNAAPSSVALRAPSSAAALGATTTKVELKSMGMKNNGYTTRYALNVTKGGHKVEYTFDDTPELDEDTSPARIENMAVKLDGKAVSLNDSDGIDAVVAVLRGADAAVPEAKQKMVRTAIGALQYD